MLLISATPSPFARKVRIALIEKGIAFEQQDEIPWHADTQTPRHNPLEQLPILIPEGGEPVFESTFILEWLEHFYPEPALVPADPLGVIEAKRVATIAEGVMDATVLLFFEAQRASPSAEWTRRQLRKVRGGLNDLNRRLGSGAWFVGEDFGIADIAVVAMLGMQDVAADVGMLVLWQAIDPDLREWRASHANLARFEADNRDRPSVRATAPVMFPLAEAVV